MTFGTTSVVGRQPYAPAAFTQGEIPGTHFQGLSRPQGTWFRWVEPRNKSPVTVWLVAQCLNHYATQAHVCVCVCVCVCVYIYIYTHTHTYIYIIIS